MNARTRAPLWDTIVIGGGAAGLSAALMLGRARRRTLVIDAGRPRNRFATGMHGVLGHEAVAPAKLLRRGRTEIAAYGVELREGTVERAEATTGGLAVALVGGRIERARTLVVATGITDELPPVPGLAERWGRTVLHCPYCHGWEVRDRRIGVLATSPLALHQARLVRQWSERVTLFSAGVGTIDPDAERRLRSRGIEIVHAPVVEILGESDQLTGLRTADGIVTEVDAVFTAGAPRPHDAFLAPLGLVRAEQSLGLGSFLAVDHAGRTSHDRVWAVGNVVNPGANIPMSIGAGALTGGAVNGFLVEEDFDLVPD